MRLNRENNDSKKKKKFHVWILMIWMILPSIKSKKVIKYIYQEKYCYERYGRRLGGIQVK